MKSPKTRKNTTYDVRNASPDLRQAQIVALLMIIVCPTEKQIIN
jgi:hypothetical protein